MDIVPTYPTVFQKNPHKTWNICKGNGIDNREQFFFPFYFLKELHIIYWPCALTHLIIQYFLYPFLLQAMCQSLIYLSSSRNMFFFVLNKSNYIISYNFILRLCVNNLGKHGILNVGYPTPTISLWPMTW